MDKCATQINNCSANAHCTDWNEGYNCTCMDGYIDKSEHGLTGRICALSNEKDRNFSSGGVIQSGFCLKYLTCVQMND